MEMHELNLEPEVDFDIDVELPVELDSPWAEESDVVELSPNER